MADKAKKEVTLEPDCPPPSPRVNGSLVPYVTPVRPQGPPLPPPPPPPL
jgi:hypothetical protein